MTTKRFIIKISIKILIFAILSVTALTLIQAPVITNEVAMGQMENSNELYMTMEMYYKLMPIVKIIYVLNAIGFAAWIGYDIYKFVMKNREKKQ